MTEPDLKTPAAAVGLLGAGILILVTTWLLTLPSSVSAAEETLFRAFNNLPDWLERPLWPVMQLGSLLAVFAAALLALILWGRRRLSVALLATGTSAWLLATLIKEIVRRGRPEALLADVNLRPSWEGFSFVSGHSSVAFALATVAAAYLGRTGKALVWTGAIAVGCLRMYAGAHLPLDVLGGAGTGIALGALALLALRTIMPSPDEPESAVDA